MAKNTVTANEAEKASPVKFNPADFENPNIGETFGGSYPALVIDEDAVIGPVEYVKDTQIQLEDDGQPKMVKVAVLKGPGGILGTGPISANFVKHFEEANLSPGDVIAIKRYKDVTKKRGKGAGVKMKIYALKVLSRAPKAE